MICLAGINGSGKTTIMDIISNLVMFLNQNVTMYDLKFEKEKPNVLTLIEFAQLDILIEDIVVSIVYGDIENIQKNDTAKKQLFIKENEISEILKKSEKLLKTKTENLQKFGQIDREGFELYNQLGKQFEERESKEKNKEVFLEINKYIEKYIGKSIIGMEEKPPFLFYMSDNDRTILDIRYTFIPKYELIYKVVHRYSSLSDDLKAMLIFYEYAYSAKYEELKMWINENVLENKKIIGINKPEFEVEIETKEKKIHGLDLLSSGEKSLLVILIQIYMAANKNTVILIDEVDKSLHPQYQEKIVEFLREMQKEKGCQIVVSAHSRFIWDGFDAEEVINL